MGEARPALRRIEAVLWRERAMVANGGLSKEELKQAVCEAIDRHGNEIIELGETILHHPETGFNEPEDRRRWSPSDARSGPRAADRPRR